jgi:hypothetical protein
MGGSENEARRITTICDQVRPNRLREQESGKMRRSKGSDAHASLAPQRDLASSVWTRPHTPDVIPADFSALWRADMAFFAN